MTELPDGFGIALDPTVQRFGNGTVLVGGDPLRILRLTAAGAAVVDALTREEQVARAGRALARRLVDAGLAHPRPPRARGRARVTVIVPVRDRRELLDACLTRLGREAPVIVVDDNSTDAAGIAAVAARHGVRLVRRERPGGPGAARNAALAHVDTDLIAFLDSDCLPPADWIERLAGHFDDPLVGAVAPRVTPRPAGAHPTASERFIAARSPIDLGAAESAVVPGGRVSYVPTAALLVRRAALRGGFEPSLRYGEDVDLVWRLHDDGWRVRYDPAVVVEHAEPRGWRALLGRHLRYGTSAAALARRHPGRLAPVVLRLGPTATALLVLARRPVLAGAAAAIQALLLQGRVRRQGLPRHMAARYAVESAGWTTIGIGHAAATLALPALALGLARRRARPAATALLLAPPLIEWRRRRPRLDPVRWTLASLADDAAYGLGVWRGCLTERTLDPVLPSVTRPSSRRRPSDR